MEAIKDWAMTMAGIVVFGSACEVMLPDGTFRKYVRLAIGMLLVLTLVAPLNALLKEDWELNFPEVPVATYTQREQMQEEQSEDVIRLYRENLEKKIRISLQTRMEAISIKVACSIEEKIPETFGTIKAVDVTLDAESTAERSETIKDILYREFGIKEKRVTIRYLKESDACKEST